MYPACKIDLQKGIRFIRGSVIATGLSIPAQSPLDVAPASLVDIIQKDFCECFRSRNEYTEFGFPGDKVTDNKCVDRAENAPTDGFGNRSPMGYFNGFFRIFHLRTLLLN